jgi:quinol monooxygenase YgiN
MSPRPRNEPAAAELAYLIMLRVAPQSVYQTEMELKTLAAAVAAEELASGDLQVFTAVRVPDDPGAYHIYGQLKRSARDRHLAGPKAVEALEWLQPHLIAPYERVEFEPVALWGADVALGSSLDGDVAWRFTVRTKPGLEDSYEDLGDDIYAAMAEEEFPTGNVKTYCTLRAVGDPGRYVMFEHFTATGSARHAKSPSVVGPGARQMRTLVPPFERLRYEPVTAIGVTHAHYGSAPPAARRERR